MTARTVVYFAGLGGVGAILYVFATPKTNSDFQKKIQEEQGTLKKDMNDTQKNTNLLLAKIRSGAGIPDEKAEGAKTKAR